MPPPHPLRLPQFGGEIASAHFNIFNNQFIIEIQKTANHQDLILISKLCMSEAGVLGLQI